MKRNVVVIITAAASLALTGCASSAHSASLGGAGTARASTGAIPGGGAARQFPGVSGLVAAISGTTAQVQSTNQQTAVTWTTATRFTEQVPASSSLLKLGSCVMARSARPGSSSNGTTPSPMPSSTTPAGGPVTEVAAATVELLPMQNGTCAAGFGGRGNASGAPSGTRTARPDGGFADRRGFGGAAFGRVTSLGAGQFTVTPVTRPGTAAPASVTVTYTSATTFTRLTTASAAAMKVGSCIAAQGRTDDTGALTATAISISAPTASGCQTGFGARGPGGGFNGGNGGPSSGPANNA